MAQAGVRELKNNLSRYLRRVAAGERIQVTDHGQVIAELGPPPQRGWHPELTARGPLVNDPAFLANWPTNTIKLPPGTGAQILDELREDKY
jgi:antitoxin (DNA-binding transcriptional repressor) of toxin-antitoxin stability system